jgi:dUTP pyrophosphatase
MKIKITKLHKDIKTPERAHYNDAGADVFTPDLVIIEAKEVRAINLGFAVEIPDGFCGLIVPKSGLTKEGIIAQIPPIDSGYRGHIHALVMNTTNKPFTFQPGQKVAQIIIVPVVLADFVEDLGDNRAQGAFGSTGK